jgi:precorrin-2 dehydrogenase
MKKLNRRAALAGVPRETSSLFPVFLKLVDRRCLAVGAGKLAEPKIEGLLAARAKLLVVAPKATANVQRWARDKKITWHERAFELTDLDEVCLIVCATSSAVTNQIVFEESRKRGVLCSVVDDAEHSDFLFPAVVERGALQIAISTAGHSAALEQRLHAELERQYGPEYESWLEWLGKARASLFADPLSPRRRRTLLRKLASQRGLEDFLRRDRRVPAEQSS